MRRKPLYLEQDFIQGPAPGATAKAPNDAVRAVMITAVLHLDEGSGSQRINVALGIAWRLGRQGIDSKDVASPLLIGIGYHPFDTGKSSRKTRPQRGVAADNRNPGLWAAAMEGTQAVSGLTLCLRCDGTGIDDNEVGLCGLGDNSVADGHQLPSQHLNFAPVQTATDVVEVNLHVACSNFLAVSVASHTGVHVARGL